MEGNIEKDCSALGGLFHHIVNDLRGSSPVWEDFTTKATKLHSTLRTTLVAISAFLEAFQKVADMATSTKGATKEIGLALTRLCLRHRSIEGKLKAFTGSITETMVTPLQDRLEEWKKAVAQLDKDHNKEYKKARLEIKKAASDTVRLQKKVKKGLCKDMQYKLDHALQDVNGKFRELEETEKNSVRKALIEERSRFCLFVTCVRPFVENEINLLTEITHLQEIMDSLNKQTANPDRLPQVSEQVILDLKGADVTAWAFNDNVKHSPPSSPSSMGSRKSSMCSISSLNSSSSGSTKSHSPSHHFRQRSVSQVGQPSSVGTVVRLTSVSSQDSGFTSQDMLFQRPVTPQTLHLSLQNNPETSSTGESTPTDSTPSTPPSEQASTPSASSTWTNWPELPKASAASQEAARPHTISTAYERSHARPALSATLFEPPVPELPEKGPHEIMPPPTAPKSSSQENESHYARPATINKLQPVLPPLGPKPKSKAVPPPMVPPLEDHELPIYVNMNELANMEAEKQRQHEGKEEGVADPGSSAQTPVTPQDTSTPNTSQSPGALDIQEAIRDLENCTAALHSDYDTGTDSDSQSQSSSITPPQKLQNSLELAEAIRELEASTAALTTAYDHSGNASRGSLQCSSGYGTMNSTPSGSEDIIATGDLELPPCEIRLPDRNKYFTIPRDSEILRAYKAALAAQRPASTAGIPVTHAGIGATKRNSKPPPPVRRSSSISAGGAPAVMPKSTRHSGPPKHVGPPANARIVLDGQHGMLHRRSHSSGSEQPHEGAIKMKQTHSADILDSQVAPQYATPQMTRQSSGPGAEGLQGSPPQYAIPHITGSAPPHPGLVQISQGYPTLVKNSQGHPTLEQNSQGLPTLEQNSQGHPAVVQNTQSHPAVVQNTQGHPQGPGHPALVQIAGNGAGLAVQPGTLQSHAGLVQSLNAKFAALQQSQQQPQPPQQSTAQASTAMMPPPTLPKTQNNPHQQQQQQLDQQQPQYRQLQNLPQQQSQQNHSPIYVELMQERMQVLQPHNEETDEDFIDLPPPPSEEELAELNAHDQYAKRPVDVVRDSLVTELKQGPQLRRTGTLEKTETYHI